MADVTLNHHTHGWSIGETAHNFGLSEAEVLAALLYYEEHREQLDSLEANEQAEMNRFYTLHAGT